MPSFVNAFHRADAANHHRRSPFCTLAQHPGWLWGVPCWVQGEGL